MYYEAREKALGNGRCYHLAAILRRKGRIVRIGINSDNNTVIVGTKEDLKKKEMFVRKINYLKYPNIEDGMECLVKVRYKHRGEIATISNDGENLRVLFHNKVEGIAPGQSAAIYEGDDLIAGGFIMKK